MSRNGAPCWGAGYLPAVYQGTMLRKGPSPVLNLRPPADVTPEATPSGKESKDAKTEDGADSRLAQVEGPELDLEIL